MSKRRKPETVRDWAYRQRPIHVHVEMSTATEYDEHIRDVLRRKQAHFDEAIMEGLRGAHRPRHPSPGVEIITSPFDVRGINAKRIYPARG